MKTAVLCLCFLVTADVWAQQPPTLVYFVRHAEKMVGSRDPWLNTEGHRRTALFGEFFKHIPIDGFIATEFLRTQQTLTSLAWERGQEVSVFSAFDSEGLLEEIKNRPGQTLLVAGHSNTIPYYLWLLGGAKFSISEDDYDNIFLAILGEDTCQFQRFRVHGSHFQPDGSSLQREMAMWRLGVFKY